MLHDKNETVLFKGKIRRVRCAICGRKIRDWRKVRKIELSVPIRGRFLIRVCEECYEKFGGD